MPSRMMNSSSNLDRFHHQRSKLIDGFASVEKQIVRLLGRSGIACGGEMLGAKIEKLKKAKPSPQYSKAAKRDTEGLLVQLEPLLPLRADVVHAPLTLATIEGEDWVCFINARFALDATPTARLIAPIDFTKLVRQVSEIVKGLTAICPVSPVASPPRPLPAATDGP